MTNFLKNIARVFSGNPNRPGADGGLYYYVKSHRCDEVIRIRINPMNDLSKRDNERGEEGDDLFARKVVVGRKCFDRMEAEFIFDKDRRLKHKEVMGGVFVDTEAYAQYQESQGEAEE